MTREDQVLALLGDANPVLDVDDLVETLNPRFTMPHNWSEEMQDTLVREIDPEIGRERRWLRPAAVAAAAVVVAVGAVGLWSSFQDSPVATSPTIDAATLYLETESSGDIEAINALRAPEAPGPFPNRDQVYANVNNRFAVESCSDTGSSSTGPLVQCVVVETNDFIGPAGVGFSYTMTLQFNEELELIALDRSGADLSEVFAYARSYWVWLRNSHPDIYADIEPWDLISLPGWNTDPAHAFVALEYVDEFIAQSDEYPVTDR